MPKAEVQVIAAEGFVQRVLPEGQAEVQLLDGRCIVAGISGKIKVRFVRVNVGDRVRCELSPYDSGKARIVELS